MQDEPLAMPAARRDEPGGSPGRPTTRSVWRGLLERLRQRWPALLSVNLAYVALGLALLAPLTGASLQLLIEFSGANALSDQDIAYFLLTPLGVVTLVLVGGLLVAIAALSQASLMYVGRAPQASVFATLRAALLFAALRARAILIFSALFVARLALYAVPFLVLAAAIAWLLLGRYDINYYLTERPPGFWAAVVLIGVIALTLAVGILHKLVGWSLTLPLLLFTDAPPMGAFRESERITAGNRPVVVGVLALWAVIAVLLGLLLLAAFNLFGGWLIPWFAGDLSSLTLVLGVVVALFTVSNLALGAWNASAFAIAITELAVRCEVPMRPVGSLPRITSSAQGNWQLGPRGLAVGLVVLVAAALGTGLWLLHAVPMSDQAEVVAHRGAAGKAPENTLAAVHQAIDDGADWVEIDVQETADGEVVVFHDSDFMKLVSVDLKVWEGTLEEIQALDIGSWRDARFAGERVPTLREVLETARGRVGILIELKYYGHDQRLEERVVEIVEEAGMASEIAIMSLKYRGIRKIHALRPDWRSGLLAAKAIGDLSRVGVDFLAVNTSMITPGFVRRAHAAGKPVLAWTVNDPVSMARVISLGVDGLITDEPALAREVLSQRAEMTPMERLLVHTAVLFERPIPKPVSRDDSP